MLGKLFNLGSGNAVNSSGPSQPHQPTNPPPPSLESVQEDIHTRHLIFPDADALFQHQNDQVFPLSTALPTASSAATSAFDYDADFELDARHVRVLIMQDAAGPYPSQLLFDSQEPPPMAPSFSERTSPVMGSQQDPRRAPRKTSLNQGSRPLVIQPDSPGPRQGAFDRRASLHGRAQSTAETELQRARREYNDEISAFSSCTFGNSELMAYKGTSTKVHIVPSPADTRSDYVGSVLGDGRGSIGRSSMRSSRLAQSYTSETVSPVHPSPSFASPSSTPRHHHDRRKILVTRLFPVILPTDDADAHSDSPHARFADHNTGFPFPQPDEPVPKRKKPQPKQKRTPMYAVVLVIQLPPAAAPMAPPPVRSTFRGPSSYTEQDSFASSLSSARRGGWAMASSGFHSEHLDSPASSDVDDRMDVVTQHWDIIMRTLTHLQSAVATSLGTLLKQEDINSPDPYAPPVASFVSRTPSFGRRAEDVHFMKPPKSNSKLVVLQSHRLQNDETIAKEAAMARIRVVSGLRAQRVITGQGRWGIWRDEARWITRRVGDGEQGFLLNLLTGFLATHTDWLQALSPIPYRRKFYEQQRAKGEEDLFLPARTLIVSPDKMLARRIIFLLSAFLPANQQVPTLRQHRPSTSTSVGTFSQSPPTYVVPILREESLRRKINRRPGGKRSHSRTASQSTRNSGVPNQFAHLAMEAHHERRASDATSIRSNLPIPGNDMGSRKSSAATTTTITPETSIPHFSTLHRAESRRPRPGSSSSLAADDLKRSLRRSETSGHVSTASTDSRASSSKWGSMISGLWSNAARRGSTSLTLPDSIGSVPNSPIKPNSSRPDKLADVVREVTMQDGYSRAGDLRQSMEAPDSDRQRRFVDEQAVEDEPDRLIYSKRETDPNSAFQSPVKTTINPEDGVIDVDIPFPDYIASFETAVSSPSSSGYLSTPGFGLGLEGFEQVSRLVVDGDLPMNVAGYLQRYHQDFVLQAVPPHEDLMEQVKQSMRSEPTPMVLHNTSTDSPVERWVDISSIVIADTSNHTITRVRYRRLIRPKSFAERVLPMGSAGSSVYGNGLLTPAVLPYETQLEEEFIEEQLGSVDDLLTEAVERVIAQGVFVSKQNSRDSSRSTSKARERSGSEASQRTESESAPHIFKTGEVPRGECKTVILSALQDIIRHVIDDREQEGQHGVVAMKGSEGLLREAVRGWLDTMDSY
ncbi:folliculin-interacting protein N-terminus-domain-containing protein [Plectosphaerella cucumerina]|uniref:Folliculin-interacting protein N-terminus-domain-containing protein n=1 Tax=Plectosphaerella cucumerina TaxID=40658 RepID=A0A8K0X0R4_9PEZI|nr:folliculin-interacting protein N-terminus-domain-containing protein [Plectosphaerella cucumerina]